MQMDSEMKTKPKNEDEPKNADDPKIKMIPILRMISKEKITKNIKMTFLWNLFFFGDSNTLRTKENWVDLLGQKSLLNPFRYELSNPHEYLAVLGPNKAYLC